MLLPGMGSQVHAQDPADASEPVPAERLAGTSRIATAVAVARHGWASAATVLLARADDFPDALAGGPLAATEAGPLLLTGRGELRPEVAAEIRRLDTDRVVLLGGEAALSDRVAAQVAALGVAVERIGGPDRYATAARVLADQPLPNEVVVASGTSFPDALAASGLQPGRILLTGRDTLPEATAALLEHADEVERLTVVGGPAVVSAEVAQAAAAGRELVRLAGAERYATSAAIAEEALARLPSAPRPLIVATGQTFPDALTAGPLSARLDAPIVLVPSDGDLPAVSSAFLATHAARFDEVVVLGGTAAVSDRVVDAVRAAVGGPLPAPDVDMADCGEVEFPCSWADAEHAAVERSSALVDESLAALRAGVSSREVVEALEAESDVAGVLDDGAAITFRVHGGLPTVVLTDDAAPGVDPAVSAARVSAPEEGEPEFSRQSYDPAGPPGHAKRALIISPYDEAWSNDATASVAAAFNARPDEYGQVTVARGQQAGISTMESIPSYDIVNVITHGSHLGFAARVASELFEYDPATHETTPVDDFRSRVPAGVGFTGDVHDSPGSRRLFIYAGYVNQLLSAANAFDMIFFGTWCKSAGSSPYALEGFPRIFASTEAAFLGWTHDVYVNPAGEAVATYWTLMVEHGLEAGFGHSMLAARDLVDDPDSDARLVILEGIDKRARDVVEIRVGGRALEPEMDLEWDGVPEDGTRDALTDLSFVVEGVEDGREGEANFQLFLRGHGVPEEEIPADHLSLDGDGTVLRQGEGFNDWLVTVDRIELPYDVTDEMVSPTPLEFEVRVGESEERYSAERVPLVRLPVGTIRAVHPDFFFMLFDGDEHPAEGVEGDGDPDHTTVVLQVMDVDGDDIDDFTVEAEITAQTLDGVVVIDEPLVAFDQLDERTYRYAEDIALDHDLRSDNRELTIAATLAKDSEGYSTHVVTVELQAQAPSDCWVERSHSGTFEDDDGDLVPIAGSDRWDVSAVADWTDDEAYLTWVMYGTGIVQISDETGAIPLGEKGTFTVPYDPGGDPKGRGLQGLGAVVATGPGYEGAEYQGPGTLEVTEAWFNTETFFDGSRLESMDAEYSGTLHQVEGSGQIDVQGAYHWTYEGCVLGNAG